MTDSKDPQFALDIDKINSIVIAHGSNGCQLEIFYQEFKLSLFFLNINKI